MRGSPVLGETTLGEYGRCLAETFQFNFKIGIYILMRGGKKNNITLYLKISLCRNSRLKRVILPHPLPYESCLDIAAVFVLNTNSNCTTFILDHPASLLLYCDCILHWEKIQLKSTLKLPVPILITLLLGNSNRFRSFLHCCLCAFCDVVCIIYSAVWRFKGDNYVLEQG